MTYFNATFAGTVYPTSVPIGDFMSFPVVFPTSPATAVGQRTIVAVFKVMSGYV